MSNVPAREVGVALEIDKDGAPELKRSVDTACLGCRFATGRLRERKSDKQLQFLQDEQGCLLDAVNKMLAQGVDVQDCEDDKGNEFHVLTGRVCPFYRTKAWRKDLLEDDEAAVKQVRKEATLRPDVVVYFDDDMKPDDILTTATALKQGRICPQKLYIINNSSLRPSQLMTTLRKCPIPWRMETVVERGRTSMPRALDIITKKCSGMFVTYFMAGHAPNYLFFSQIDSALYDDLDKFVVLHPEDLWEDMGRSGAKRGNDNLNGLTVLSIFHKQVGGNARYHIVDKATNISKEQKCPNLVRPLKTICPQ
jgi:hypothetical protein